MPASRSPRAAAVVSLRTTPMSRTGHLSLTAPAGQWFPYLSHMTNPLD
jgi:hypothetical protein